jgi:UDPglucose 6-dehydrogenase
MKIAIVGTGYVGLVTGACFADSGNDVICVDNDLKKIAMLKENRIPIFEPGLRDIVERNVKEGRLKFTDNLEESVKNSLIIFVAVGTPSDMDGSADLTAVLSVASDIGKFMNGFKIVVVKSTVPVGTCDKVKGVIKAKTKHDFDVVSNPEFLKEGAAIDDFVRPDRVVIGTDNVRTAEIMKEIYAPYVRTGNPIIVMDQRSSELTKYASNGLLATKISFMNELAKLCEKVGANVDMVRIGMGSDSRIGHQFLFPGAGFGGSCFPKDVRAIVSTGKSFGLNLKVLKSVNEVNDDQKKFLAEKVLGYFGKDAKGKKIAIWGISFKPKTDDIREAPSLVVIDELLKAGVKISVYDPEAMENIKSVLGETVSYAENNYDVLKDADALVVVTEWGVFRRPDFERMKSLMRKPVVFDGRNIYNPHELKELGFTYFSIGRPPVNGDE